MKVIFKPDMQEFLAPPQTKILIAARKAKAPIIFGCASCRCGTCAVAVLSGALSPMAPEEQALLLKMKLTDDGTVRLSCQARTVDEDVMIDLDFQKTYSPDAGIFK